MGKSREIAIVLCTTSESETEAQEAVRQYAPGALLRREPQIGGLEDPVLARIIKLARQRPGQVAVIGHWQAFGRRPIMAAASARLIASVGGARVHVTQALPDQWHAGYLACHEMLEAYDKAVLALRGGRKARPRVPPYGWRYVNHELVPDTQEQAAVAAILGLQAQGCSVREIAGHMTEHMDRFRPRGESWQSTTIHRILKQHERRLKQA